jgi:hypothetical protein
MTTEISSFLADGLGVADVVRLLRFTEQASEVSRLLLPKRRQDANDTPLRGRNDFIGRQFDFFSASEHSKRNIAIIDLKMGTIVTLNRDLIRLK